MVLKHLDFGFKIVNTSEVRAKYDAGRHQGFPPHGRETSRRNSRKSGRQTCIGRESGYCLLSR